MDYKITSEDSNCKVLWAIGGGGFLWESTSLIENMKGDHKHFFYVTTNETTLPENFPSEKTYIIRRVTTLRDKSRFNTLAYFLASIFDSIRCVRKTNPELVICVGSSIAVPLALACRILNKKIYFIESMTRIENVSKTAKILHRLHIADRIYVQWPWQKKTLKGSHYEGTVL
jgi:UDP-N-acetylglucosamine:LPS N-acetylglucosamine transferase